MFVCLFVWLSVCSFFRYHLNVFLPPLPKVGRPKLLELSKKSKFLGEFCKDQYVIQQGSGGYTSRIMRLHNKDQGGIHQGSGGYWQDFLVSVLLSASVKRCFVPVCGLYFKITINVCAKINFCLTKKSQSLYHYFSDYTV